MKINNKQTVLKPILLLLILIATIFSYSNILGHDFQLIWGDNTFLLNQNIMEFSLRNIAGYFGSFIDGSYQPLSSLFFSLNYRLFGVNPEAYHILNIIFHLVNISLVFLLINKLTGKLELSVIVALFFGIHPMHVESVAWISGFRDLLCSLFFLLSLIFYYRYISGELKRKYYYLSLVMFLLSLMSKSIAVTLPVVLLLFDYYNGREITKKTFSGKIPFFALAIIFGVIAIIGNQASEEASMMSSYSFGDRFFVISYGIFAYMVMLFYPIKGFAQSAIHYFPEKINGFLPIEYYIAPAVILVIILLILILKRYRKELAFGFLFFLITISVVSQIIPFGQSVISERFTYIPYIGLFFMIAYIYDKMANIWRYRRIAKPILILILLALGILFSIKTWNRNRVWKDSITLFGNVARRYPAQPEGYFMKGLARYKVNDIRGAVIDYNYATNIDRQFKDAFFWRGIGRFDLGLPVPAIHDFDHVIFLDPQHKMAYQHRGEVKINIGELESAIEDLNMAISLDHQYYEAYKNRSIAKFRLNISEDALQDINKALELKPGEAEAYYHRGVIYQSMQRIREACSDWEKADSLGFERAAMLMKEYCR